jgi:hypothetical protein
MRKHRPDDFITKMTALAPSQEEDCPQFKAFLNRIYRRKNEAGEVVPDLELQAYAQVGLRIAEG